MLIDWFTVIAQVFNFLILVWLLKRFLYKPILDAIDARESRIAKSLAEADQKKMEAQQEREEYEIKNQTFNQERDTMVRQMRDEVNLKRQNLIDEAHQAADDISTKRYEALQRGQNAFGTEIARRAQDQIFLISRKTLQDLADTNLEERITEVFIRKLREIDGDEKRELAEALIASSKPANVSSAFELSKEQQASIRQALNETFASDISVRFEIKPQGVGGIELTSNGQRIGWNIDGYLSFLQKSIAELTDAQLKTKDGNPSDGEMKVPSELLV